MYHMKCISCGLNEAKRAGVKCVDCYVDIRDGVGGWIPSKGPPKRGLTKGVFFGRRGKLWQRYRSFMCPKCGINPIKGTFKHCYSCHLESKRPKNTDAPETVLNYPEWLKKC